LPRAAAALRFPDAGVWWTDVQRLRSILSALRRERSGTASIEFGVVAGTLVLVMLNGVEVARYYYAKMELQNAVHMAGQAVWDNCETAAQLPTNTNCTNRDTRMTNALQSTSLGSSVTLSSGFPTEQWYCVNSSTGALSAAGTTQPSNCSAYGGLSSEEAGYYIRIQGQYTYQPLFTTITVGNSMPTTVTATSMTRLQ
jgi:Flp pilus assembly protein TadG